MRVWDSPFDGVMSIQNFIKIHPVVELNCVDRRMDMGNPVCIHFMHII
jgi:hypothetical protein